jgi:hypothetical protein
MTQPSYEGTSNVTVPPVPPPDPVAGDGEPVPVFVTVAVRTSAGPGPGVRRLPPAEAAALVRMKYAIHGDQPPRGFNLEV